MSEMAQDLARGGVVSQEWRGIAPDPTLPASGSGGEVDEPVGEEADGQGEGHRQRDGHRQ
jgi:hypothetical protein